MAPHNTTGSQVGPSPARLSPVEAHPLAAVAGSAASGTALARAGFGSGAPSKRARARSQALSPTSAPMRRPGRSSAGGWIPPQIRDSEVWSAASR